MEEDARSNERHLTIRKLASLTSTHGCNILEKEAKKTQALRAEICGLTPDRATE